MTSTLLRFDISFIDETSHTAQQIPVVWCSYNICLLGFIIIVVLFHPGHVDLIASQ